MSRRNKDEEIKEDKENKKMEINLDEEKEKIEIKPDAKKYKTEMKLFSEGYSNLSFKVPYNQKSQQKSISTKIRGYLATIIKNGYTTIPLIKGYLTETRRGRPVSSNPDRDTRIIQTILQCRTSAKRVIFNSNMFKRPLIEYIFCSKVKTKCLTNDYLYLLSTCNQIIDSLDYGDNALDGCQISSVKVISDNFSLNEDTRKGLIQDFDPTFSAICTKNISAEDIKSVIDNNTGKGTFKYDNIDFEYYGDDNLSIVKLADVDSTAAAEKFSKMIYLKTEGNKFTEGEKTLPFNDEVHYIDVTLTPDDFCPCFWTTATSAITVDYLFEFQRDYNVLFNQIIDSYNKSKNTLTFPANMCYWNTLNQAMDFAAVIAIAGVALPDQVRTNIADNCDNYYELKPYIRKWKENQLLLERILKEFCTYFLNKSELLRFFRLIEKCNKYMGVYNLLVKQDKLYQLMKNLFETIPFAQMIRQQLNNPCYELVRKIKQDCEELTQGVRNVSLSANIRNHIKDIHDLLPNEETTKTNSFLFPFIIADGGINGSAVNVSRDYIGFGVASYQENISKKKEKKKRLEQSFGMNYNEQIQLERDYITAYLKDRFKGVKWKKGTKLAKFIDEAVAEKSRSQDAIEDVFEGALKYKELKNKENFKVNSRNQCDFLEAFANARIAQFGISDLEISSSSDEGEDVMVQDDGKEHQELIIADPQQGKTTKYKKIVSSNIVQPNYELLAKKISRERTKKKNKKKGGGYAKELKGLGNI